MHGKQPRTCESQEEKDVMCMSPLKRRGGIEHARDCQEKRLGMKVCAAPSDHRFNLLSMLLCMLMHTSCVHDGLTMPCPLIQW